MVEVVTQFELIRSSGVFVCMCALTQHWYAVPGSNPLTWTLVVPILMLNILTSWICLSSDSNDVVHDKSYPFMVLLSDCCPDHFIVTEVESAITTGYSLLENYNNSVEKVLTLMTLYLKIVLNMDVFQHAILSSCWKFWRV